MIRHFNFKSFYSLMRHSYLLKNLGLLLVLKFLLLLTERIYVFSSWSNLFPRHSPKQKWSHYIFLQRWEYVSTVSYDPSTTISNTSFVPINSHRWPSDLVSTLWFRYILILSFFPLFSYGGTLHRFKFPDCLLLRPLFFESKRALNPFPGSFLFLEGRFSRPFSFLLI